jgi:hypothetical protein
MVVELLGPVLHAPIWHWATAVSMELYMPLDTIHNLIKNLDKYMEIVIYINK